MIGFCRTVTITAELPDENTVRFRGLLEDHIYAMDLELVKKSWDKVIDMGAETIYPGHGKPFPLNRIKEFLN